jgi:hypothetical protein
VTNREETQELVCVKKFWDHEPLVTSLTEPLAERHLSLVQAKQVVAPYVPSAVIWVPTEFNDS